MHWPLESSPVSRVDLGEIKCVYLGSCGPSPDPSMVWGTTVDMTGMNRFLQECNRNGSILISPAHVLLAAVGRAVARHSCMRRRVVGKRVFQFKQINVVMPSVQTRYGQVDVLVLENVDQRPSVDIARQVWKHNCDAALLATPSPQPKSLLERLLRARAQLDRRFRLWWILRIARIGFWLVSRWNLPAVAWSQKQIDVVALVNYLGFKGAPPLTSYKPSKLPLDGVPMTVTMGPTEPQPVVIDGAVVVRPVASLFVRSDHRIADAHEFGNFVATLRGFLLDPATIEQETENKTNDKCLSKEPSSTAA